MLDNHADAQENSLRCDVALNDKIRLGILLWRLMHGGADCWEEGGRLIRPGDFPSEAKDGNVYRLCQKR